MFKRLSELNSGKKATIRSFENEELFIKLMEMGCVPGEIITIEKSSATRDPITINISGYRLSLRLDEAHTNIVEEFI